MPRTKASLFTSTAELAAMIERVAPDILALLADGVPRAKAAIVKALAGGHAVTQYRRVHPWRSIAPAGSRDIVLCETL